MKKFAQKSFAIFLMLVMLFSICPMEVFADSTVSETVGGGGFYTVTYYNGETVVTRQYYTGGGTIEQVPETETQESVNGVTYVFSGWYTAPNCEGTEVGAGTPVTGNMNIYAGYKEVETVKVTLLYKYGEEEVGRVEADYILSSESVSHDVPATIDWVDDQGETVSLFPESTKVTFTPDETKTIDVPYHSEMAEATVYYVAIHEESDLGNDKANKRTLCDSVTVHGKTGDTIQPEIKEFPDQYAVYYKTLDEDGGETPTFGTAKTVYVYYLDDEVTITYETNGGSYVASKSAKYGSDVAIYDSSSIVCGKKEHTHTSDCYTTTTTTTSTGSSSSSSYGYGYGYGNGGPGGGGPGGGGPGGGGSGGGGSSGGQTTTTTTVLTCTKEEHTHSDACYGPIPTKSGYIFGGWYLDEACTISAIDGIEEIDGNKTVYAKWIGGTANYTIVYQKQEPDGSYSYVGESTVENADVGSVVSGTDAADITFTNSAYYHRNGGTSASVKSDGSTVVLCYYDLNVYTVTFSLGSNTSAKMTIGGATYTSKSAQYSFQARLGEDIADRWPTEANITGAQLVCWDATNASQSSYSSKRFNFTTDMLTNLSTADGTALNLQATYADSDDRQVTLHYMLQTVEGSDYPENEAYRQTAWTSGGFGQKDIEGFNTDASSKNKTRSENNKVVEYWFYYNRNKYSITYVYKDTTAKATISNIPFEQDISGTAYSGAPATSPAGVDSEAVFAGWYDNPECVGEAYKFTTMPAKNLLLYAKYALPEKTVTFVDRDEEITKQTVTKGSTASTVAGPTRTDGYTFTGWYTEAACKTLYDFNTPVTSDITLYAGWKQAKITYSVRYLDNSGKELASTRYRNTESYTYNQEVTEDALLIYGYRPDESSKSIRLKANDSDNVITFYYTKKAETTYTLCYETADGTTLKDKETKKASADVEQVVCDAPATLTVDEQQYYITNAPQTLVLSSDAAKNVITFIYAPYQTGKLTVHYVDESYNPISGVTDVTDKSLGVRLGYNVSLTEYQKTIQGYEFVGFKNTDGQTISANQVCVDSRTVYAVYKQTQYSLTIHYVYADGKKAADDYTQTGLHYGDTYSVSSPIVSYCAPDQATVSGTIGSDTNKTIEVTVTYTGTATATATVTGYDGTYDGKEHGAVVTITGLPQGYTYVATSDAKATNATTTDIVAKCNNVVIKDASGNDVTSLVNITYENGYIRINPAVLTVTTPSATKTYDGTALTAEGTVTGFVNGETATLTTTGSQTEVGSSSNSYKLTFDKAVNKDNYTIQENLGTLTVTEMTQTITVTTTGGTYTYDGEAHGATVAVSGLPENWTYEASSSSTATNVGTVTAKCDSLVIRNAAGVDVTDNLKLDKQDGTITITPATLTVTTPSASKTYDGTALVKTDGASVEGFVDGESGTFTVTGSQTDVGSSENGYTLTLADNTSLNNYNVVKNLGKLEVTEYAGEITVTTTGGTYTYDGTAHGATVEVSALPTGYTLITAESSASATHVADGTVTANCDTLVINNASGIDVTDKLNITYVTGSITITAAPLTITTPNESKVYDGTALTAEGTVTGFVNGETATFTTTGTQTAVGSSDNTYTLTFDKTAKESDYAVSSETVGTLTVTESADQIVVTVTGGEFTYDGTAHGATVSVSELPTGYTLKEAKSKATATHVEEGEVTANCDTLVILNTAGVDVTASLNIQKNSGTIKITPKTLTVTTPSASKLYDGIALTAEGTIEGFVDGETATFATTGTQTAADSSTNTYTLTFDKNAKETDYTVQENLGTLTVQGLEGSITVTAKNGTFTYDGTAHGAEYEIQGLPDGWTCEVATKTVTHVSEGAVAAEITTLVIKNADGVDVTNNLTNIVKNEGTIQVTPKSLKVTTSGASKTYDGTALTESQGSVDGVVAGEIVSVKTTGAQTEVGESDNTYVLIFGDETLEDDYIVGEEDLGKLIVQQFAGEVTVTTTGGTFTYDGQSHSATVSVAGLPDCYAVETAESTAAVTHVEDGSKDATCDKLVIKNAAGTDVTESLNITKVDGTIEVTPATLTIVTPTKSKTYDGTALTAEGTIEGFVNGETATFTTTGTQTEIGSSENSYTLTFDKTARETDYTVNKTVGTLTVDDSINASTEVIVTTTGGTFTYDGQPHGANVSVTGLPAGYSVGAATSKDTATHVTDKQVIADCDELKIVNVAGVDCTDRFAGKITYVNGTIEITPATLTVKTPDAEKVYDGTALTAEGSITGFIGDEKATFSTTGIQTAVGSSVNTYSLKFNSTAAEDDYIVSEDLGTLTVTEYAGEITITIEGGTPEYDGKPHTGKVTVDGLPKNGYRIEYTIEGEVTNVKDGEKKVVVKYHVYNENGDDVTDKVKINVIGEDSTIKIMPKTLTVTTDSATKTYDGTPLTASGCRVTGYIDGETITITATGSRTAVGSSDNTYNLDYGTADPTNYTVNETVGTLTVNEHAETITVTVNGGEFTYDGKAHGATVSVSELPEGYTVEEAASDAQVTNVSDGTVTAECDTLIIKNAAGQDVTANLKIEKFNDTIKIKPATLTVTTSSASKIYDGIALTAPGEITGFVNGETATFVVTGSQTEADSSKNTYSLTFDKTAKKDNYTVTENLGTLTVTELTNTITVTTTGETVTYDGKAHGATVSVTGLPEGWTCVATSSDTATAAGTVTATCDKLVIKNAAGVDVTESLKENQKLYIVDGIITINKAELTVITQSASKTYDGTALEKKDGAKVTGFVNGESGTITVTGTQTDVGSSENDYVLNAGANTSLDNYELNEQIGTLEVTEYADEITVTTTGETVTYDGKAHGAEVTVSTLPKGYTLSKAASSASAKNAGTVTADCDTLVILNASGEDVTNKLNITKIAGSITITKAPLTIVTPSASKVYDGTALTEEGTIEGFVNGETATFTTTGTQTAVGSSENSYTLSFDGTAIEGNYFVTSTTVGTLTVTESADQIIVTVTGGEFTYDGTTHKATVSVSELPAGYKLEAASSKAELTHAGTVTAKVDTLIIRNAQGEDVTDKLSVSKVPASIIINPALLTVTTDGASKTYDGTALTASGTVTGFVGNETATFEVTGSQTEPGKSTNTYKLTFDKTAEETDYTITETLGELNVDELGSTITIKTIDGNFTYDGQPHGATIDVMGLPTGWTYEVTSTTTVTDVSEGAVTAKIEKWVIRNAQGVDVTEYVKDKVTTTEGTIQITPALLTVTTESASKIYDGTALTEKKASVEGFITGESITIETTGTQTKVGSSSNTYSLTYGEGTDSQNYKVGSEILGTLTVSEYAGAIVVTTTAEPSTYTGTAHGATVTVSELPAGYTVEKAECSTTITHVYESPKTAVCDTLIIKNAEGEDVTKKLNITRVEGTITITPATLSISTPTTEKKYDGKPLTAEGIISGLVNGETATFTTTGTQTDIGTSDNTYTLKFDGTAKASDYAIQEAVGTLTVKDSFDKESTKVTVTITGEDVTYDGKDHGATVTVSELPSGYHVEKAVSNDKARNAGEVEADCDEIIIKNAAGVDCTEKFKDVITQEKGTIKIAKRTLTITTESANKVYDGEALTASGKIEGLVEGETAEFKTTGTQTLVGTSKNTYSLVFGTEPGWALKENYVLSEKIGTLTVSEYAKEITITIEGGTPEYDGDTHTGKVTIDGLPEKGYRIEYTITGEVTDVEDGEKKVTVIYHVYNENGDDVTDKVKINVIGKDSTIQIKPKTLYVTTDSATKTYDGTPLTANGCSVTGYIDGETITITATGSQTAVGKCENTYTLDYGTAKEKNYVVEAKLGTLEVTEYAGKISIDLTGGEIEYDGESHTGTVVIKGLPDSGYTVEYELDGDVTHVKDGEVTVKFKTLVIRNEKGENVTDKLNLEVQDEVKLKIVPKPLIIKTDSAEKLYDGEALVADKGTVEGLVDGDTVELKVNGRQTNIGKSNNTYELVYTGDTQEDDYTVKPELGSLEVTGIVDLELTKVSDYNTADRQYAKAGDVITYVITLKNNGTVDLKNLTVTDSLTHDTWEPINLKAGESWSETVTYTVTREDANADTLISNTATVKIPVNPENGKEKTIPETCVVPVKKYNPSLKVTERSIPSATPLKPGDTITYIITVINDGNVTLKDIHISSKLIDQSWDIPEMIPGEQQEFTFVYTVTAQDIYNGTVDNEITAEGKQPNDDPVTASDKTSDVTETVARTTVTYTVYYKDTEGNTIDIVTETGTLGSTINSSNYAIGINGYNYKGANTESIVLTGDKNKDVITLTYARQVQVIIQYVDTNGNPTKTPDVTTHEVGEKDILVETPHINGHTLEVKNVIITDPLTGDVTVTVMDSANGETAEWGKVTGNGDDGYVVETIEEDEVPLAIRDSLHMDGLVPALCMTIALLVECLYISKKKKYEQRIFELNCELAGVDPEGIHTDTEE